MQKKIGTGILVASMMLGITACGSNQDVQNTGTQVGSVEEKHEEKFQVVDGKVEVYLPVHYTFSQTQESYGDEIIVQDEGNMEYDQNGLLMKEEIHTEDNVDGFNESDYTNTYRYNTKYQLVHANDESEYASYYDGGTVEYSYDYEDGNLSSIERVGRTGEETVYSFDQESGVLIQSVAYDTSLSGTVTRTYTYQYDKEANITRYDTNYDSTKSGSEYEGYYSYEYNDNGDVVKRIHVDYAGNQSEANVVYDADGYITSCDKIRYDGIQIEYNKLHKPVSINYGDWNLRYEYDNDRISKIFSEEDEYTAVLNLQYDENGNLTEITNEKDTNYKVSIEYEKYYVDQEYFEYYFNCYYNRYQTIPLDNIFRFCITEINNDVLQGDILSEFCNLPYVSMEDYYTGNVLKADAIPEAYMAILNMPEWKQAYVDFLSTSSTEVAYGAIAYLDEDDIPELFICTEKQPVHMTGVNIYTVTDGQIKQIGDGEYGAYGSVSLYERTGIIVLDFFNMGVQDLCYYELNENYGLDLLTHMVIMNIDVPGSTSYYIDDVAVTQEEWEQKKSEVVSSDAMLVSAPGEGLSVEELKQVIINLQ